MSSSTISFVYIVFLIAIFYLLLIRPQQLRAKQHRQLISELKAGDRIVTVGGICGVIKSITDDIISLEIADKVVVKVTKGSVARRE